MGQTLDRPDDKARTKKVRLRTAFRKRCLAGAMRGAR
jgi:hypothetical protein